MWSSAWHYLVTMEMESGEENGRKINKKTNELVFEGLSLCLNYPAIATVRRILLLILFLLPAQNSLSTLSFQVMFTCSHLLRVLEGSFICFVLYFKEKACAWFWGRWKLIQVSREEIKSMIWVRKAINGCSIGKRLELEKQMEGRLQALDGQGKKFALS